LERRANESLMGEPLFPRDVLNRIKWTSGSSLTRAQVVILHRGAPGDRKKIPGSQIISVGHLFFETTEATIPLHRILEIWYDGKLLFDRGSVRNKESD